MPAKLSIVQEKGQVTIPTEIRKKLGLKKGDYVAFIETEHGVVLAPREVVAAEAMARLGDILRENGVTLEGWLESTHDTRGELLKEQYGLTADE